MLWLVGWCWLVVVVVVVVVVLCVLFCIRCSASVDCRLFAGKQFLCLVVSAITDLLHALFAVVAVAVVVPCLG